MSFSISIPVIFQGKSGRVEGGTPISDVFWGTGGVRFLSGAGLSVHKLLDDGPGAQGRKILAVAGTSWYLCLMLRDFVF